uniref:NAD-dependent epimerase/dehydratase family protein n=1 Tax=Anaerolinea thermolimosa TaxID=229919 RepID=A0A7C4PFV4_9CHLR
MKVLVTGATGFTGSYVVPLLLEKGCTVRCLARPSSNLGVLSARNIEWVIGDLADFDTVRQAAQGMDALANVASIGFGHAPNITRAISAAGIRRAVFISTTAIFTSLNAASKAARMAAERTIADSCLNWTILRPTMIYGSSRDRNMARLIRYLKLWPVVPVIGSGENLQQPVYVEDVARSVVDCLFTDRTVGKAYNIPGKMALSFNQVIDTIAVIMGRRILKIHFPVKPVVSTLHAIERLGLQPPIKAEQILRLNEDKTFDFQDATADFGYSPRSFEDGIRIELVGMGWTV